MNKVHKLYCVLTFSTEFRDRSGSVRLHIHVQRMAEHSTM